MTEIRSVYELPLAERRYIAVMSDKDFDNKRSRHNLFSYNNILWNAVPLIAPGGIAVRLAVGGLISYLRQRDSSTQSEVNHMGNIIQAIPLREASRFKFMSGCAEVGRAYAANPLDNRTYFSVETYNDDMIDHKLSELERILNSLGAIKYEIIMSNDDNESSSFKLGGGTKLHGKAGAQARLDRARASRFERSGTSAGRDPAIPNDCVWLTREPSWQALVESRLYHGRKDFKLRVDLERDLRLSSKVTADIKALKLDANLTHKKSSSVMLSVVGTFGS